MNVEVERQLMAQSPALQAAAEEPGRRWLTHKQ
jgi:hypothetical protein